MGGSLAGSLITAGGGLITITGDWGKGASFTWPMTPAGAKSAAADLAAKGLDLPNAWAASGPAKSGIGAWMVAAGAPTPKKARVSKLSSGSAAPTLKVACPKCRAYAGMPCRSGSGYGMPHPARVAAAA